MGLTGGNRRRREYDYEVAICIAFIATKVNDQRWDGSIPVSRSVGSVKLGK